MPQLYSESRELVTRETTTMAIQSATWADLGFRKVGPLPVAGNGLTPAEIAGRLTRLGDYEATTDCWVRRYARRKDVAFPASIEVDAVLEANTLLDNDCFAFLERHAQSEWVRFQSELPQFQTEFTELIELIRDAENAQNRWRGMYFLACAIAFVAPEFRRAVLRDHLLPCFFRLYPQAKIVVLRYNTNIDAGAAMLRTMYAMAQAPLPELAKDSSQGVGTLREWHMTSLSDLMPALLDFFNYLFYPFVGGTCANLPGLAFLFLLDPPEIHKPGFFPRNWLAFASANATFAKETVDMVELAQDPKGPAAHRAGHHRFCHAHGFGAEDRLQLLYWYIGRLNRFLFELTDVANFTHDLDPAATVDPVFGYEHQITVDRLFRKTLLAMSMDVAPMANLMAFEIADLYDTLSRRLGNTTSDADFFRILFDPSDGPGRIGRHTAGLPEPFAKYFADVATRVYGRIAETVVDSIWRAGKVTTAGVLVRDRNLTSEAPIPAPRFVAATMRAYRNTHHGYFTAGDPANRPSRYLFMVDGSLPVEMSALPSLWWLAYLADPTFVGWNHLPVGAFD
jgi:hypothetical protein